MAVLLGVAMGTLRQALQELEAEGRIRRVRGHGTFVTTPDEHRSLVRSNLLSLIAQQVRGGLYPSLIQGFEAAAGTDYQILVGSSGNDLTRQEDLLRQAVEHHVAGVAMVPTNFVPTPPEQLRFLEEHHIPLVFCHRQVEGVTAPLVTWSGRAAGQMVAQTLLEHRHRCMATVVAFRDPQVNAAVGGIQETIAAAGLEPSAYRVRYYGERLPGEYAREAIREVLSDLLAGPDRPTAIHCLNLPDAEQVFLLAGEMGLAVPADLSLIYFGDSHRSGGLAQRLSCVAVDAELIGRQAGELLQTMISGRLRDPNLRIEVPLALLPGETVGPPLETPRHSRQSPS